MTADNGDATFVLGDASDDALMDADIDRTATNMERMRRRAHPIEQGTRHGRAFIVEALVLVVFLMASLAVLTSLMVSSYERGAEANDLSYAVVMAANDAEMFAADPTGHADNGDGSYVPTDAEAGTEATSPSSQNGLQLSRSVQQHPQEAGTLYEAHITVSRNDEVIYELDTSRYVSRSANTQSGQDAASQDSQSAQSSPGSPKEVE